MIDYMKDMVKFWDVWMHFFLYINHYLDLVVFLFHISSSSYSLQFVINITAITDRWACLLFD